MKKILSLILALSLIGAPLPAVSQEKGEEWRKKSGAAQKCSFEDLPRHLGNDLKETFGSGWHLLALAGGAGLVAGIHEADPEIQKAFQPERPLGKKFDKIISIGFHPLVLGGATLATLWFSGIVGAPKVSVTASTMLEAFFLTEAITTGLKFATQRGRPDGSNSHSFPSGHVSGAFALATVTEVFYGPWFGIPSFALASLVGASRIDSNKHVASDVVAGALLGTLIGLGTAKFHKKEFADFFIVPTAGHGVTGLSLVSLFK